MVPHLRRPGRHPGAGARRRRGRAVLREALPAAPPRLGPAAAARSAPASSTTPPTLVWLANLAALELHTQQHVGRRRPTRPRAVVFDLDPGPPAGVLDCARTALDLRSLLERLGLVAFVKTSGSKGLHLSVPLHTDGIDDEHDQDVRARARPALAERRPGPGDRHDGQGPARREGVRRLEPERRAQDDGRGVLAAHPAAADRLDPGHAGTRSRTRSTPATPTRLTFETADALAPGRASSATSTPGTSPLPQTLPALA